MIMERGKMSSLKNVIRVREAGVFGALCLIVVIMSILSPYFLRPDNIFNVLRGMSTIGIISIGMTMIIITGGIDLSVGSILGVTAMFTARLMYQGISPVLAIFGGFGLGCLLGFTNGIIITKVKIAPFIVTLGMLSIGRGLTYLLATGLRGTVASNIPMTNEFIGYLGAGYIGPIPFPVIEMTILVVLFSLFVKYTVIGRQIYAVGSNEEAARLSGVNVDSVKLFVYTTTGALCTLAGLMNAGLLSTAATNAGQGNELDVVAAVVIGGASLNGGQGSIIGTIIGAAIMAVLRNSFILLRLPAYMQTVTIGVVIILAVSTDRLRKAS
jgi:ribose transport system permease protein